MNIAYRYDAIVDECMALAAAWRSAIEKGSFDRAFHADQHRRALLRAAMFARLAEKARDSGSGPQGGDGTAPGEAPQSGQREALASPDPNPLISHPIGKRETLR